MGGVSLYAVGSWGRGDVSNSFLPAFFNAAFPFITLKPDIVVSLMVFLGFVKVYWI